MLAKQWNGEDKAVNKHPDLIYIAGDELRPLCGPARLGRCRLPASEQRIASEWQIRIILPLRGIPPRQG